MGFVSLLLIVLLAAGAVFVLTYNGLTTAQTRVMQG